MSELIKRADDNAETYSKLLAGTSVFALTAWMATAGAAQAASDDRPQLWIELGGQLSRLDSAEEVFAPQLMAGRPSVLGPSQKFEHPPHFSFDGDGKLSLQPKMSDWMFSASAKFGRSTSRKHAHNQTHPAPFVKYYYTSNPSAGSGHISRRPQKNVASPHAAKFADTDVLASEHHFVIDFQAGKDVGLGMFGSRGGSSVVNLGVRFAQFNSRSNIALKSNPDWQFNYKYLPSLVSYNRPSSKFAFGEIYHSNSASLQASRSFHGIGPSLSWNASAPVAGNQQEGQLTFDWTVSAAVLFGRQRTKVHHQTTGRYHGPKYNVGQRNITHPPTPFDQTRSRSVTVPNIGGSLGVSYRMEDFKMSVGYRADFFFGAIDGGINGRKSEDRGFFGPYASVSIGLGG